MSQRFRNTDTPPEKADKHETKTENISGHLRNLSTIRREKPGEEIAYRIVFRADREL